MDFPFAPPAERTAFYIADLAQDIQDRGLHVLDHTGLNVLLKDSLTDEDAAHANAMLSRLRPDDRHHPVQASGEVRIVRRWEKHRETYEPHPALTRQLMRLSSDTMVPADVLRRLPHINPRFLLTGAPEVIHGDGARGRIIALTIDGIISPRFPFQGNTRPVSGKGEGILTDTNDPEANGYRVLVTAEVLDEQDRVIDVDQCQLTVPIYGTFTLEELVVSVAATFSWAPLVGTGDEFVRRAYLEEAARCTVGHLLYACSRTVEVDDKPRKLALAPPAKKGGPKRPPTPRVYRMGWQIGVAIADSVRRAADPRRAPGPGTGGRKRPHMRSPHLHLYRVGPGRQEVDVKWLDYIPVNPTGRDAEVVTNHPMR